MIIDWIRRAFYRLLGRSGAPDSYPNSEIFPAVDVDMIAKALKIERRGERDAEAGMPKSDSEGLSQAEHEVVERVNKIRKKGLENYELQIGAYANRIRGAKAARGNVEIEAGQFATDFEIESRACANHLHNAMERVRGSYEKLEAYRNKHGTKGLPDDPKNTVLMIGIILIIFVIECGLSGALLSEKNEMGLLGGIVIAFVISAVNVLACLLCGFGTRYINLKPFGSKIFGCLVFLLFIVILAFFNLFVAHFRDALESYEWSVADSKAVFNLHNNVLGINSFNSWILAALGVIVSVIAFIEGFVWLDRHPGFNGAYTAAERAVSNYAMKYEQAQRQLEGTYSMARDGLKGHAQRMRANVQSALEAVGNHSHLTLQLRTFLKTCDRAVNLLHACYREANTRTRSDQRPRYFDRDFSFEEYLPDAKLSNIDTEAAKAEIESVDKIVERGVSDILEAQKSAISAFPTVVQLKEQLRAGSIFISPAHASSRDNRNPSTEGAC